MTKDNERVLEEDEYEISDGEKMKLILDSYTRMKRLSYIRKEITQDEYYDLVTRLKTALVHLNETGLKIKIKDSATDKFLVTLLENALETLDIDNNFLFINSDAGSVDYTIDLDFNIYGESLYVDVLDCNTRSSDCYFVCLYFDDADYNVLIANNVIKWLNGVSVESGVTIVDDVDPEPFSIEINECEIED